MERVTTAPAFVESDEQVEVPVARPFDRVLVVMFENQYRSYVLHDPFMRKLASAGIEMTNYFGVFHPSQTNYVAALAGELCGVTNDVAPATPLAQRTLVDLIEEAGLSWKAYMEGYPGQTWDPSWQQPVYPPAAQPISEAPGPRDLSRYFRKHNPFASFHRIQSDEQRWSKIVDDHQFWRDADAGQLPNFGWFTPDIWNDGHYLYNTHVDTNPRTQLVPQVSSWLEYVFFGSVPAKKVRGAGSGADPIGLGLDIDLLLTDPGAAWRASKVADGTVIMVTFDEADFDARGYDTSYDGPNQVYTVLLGPGIAPGSHDHLAYNHYSLIKTICRNFSLADLGKNDRDANSFRSLWGETFAWSAPQTVATTSSGHVALTVADGAPLIFVTTPDGDVTAMVAAEDGWSTAAPLGVRSDGQMIAVTADATVHLVVMQGRQLVHLQRADDHSWTTVGSIGETAGHFAMCSYDDLDDERTKLMMCSQNDDGFISFRIFDDGAWSEAANVGQLTDGPMALTQFGPSIFLVYKERRTRKMRMTSFNVASFNTLTAADFASRTTPDSRTSLHQWAPMDFAVGAFSRQFGALHNDYQHRGPLALAAAGGEMRLIHRGAHDDTPNAFSESFGLTGVVTAASVDSNGYGTLRQAGWSIEQQLPDVLLDENSYVVSAGDGERIHVAWQAQGTRDLMYCVGEQRIGPARTPST